MQAENGHRDVGRDALIDDLALDLRDAMEAVKILNELKYKTEAGEPLRNGIYA
jgi:hypothetical protein